MIKLKTEEEIKKIREGGKILAKTLRATANKVKPGITTRELDWFAENMLRENGAKPAFKNYRPDFASRTYPATICASINNVVVHGIPNNEPLREGEILSIDIGAEFENFFTDMAITVPVGNISPEAKKLISVTKKCLDLAIKKAQPGGFLGDIGFVIEETARKNGFHEVRLLTGHGVGYKQHEDPDVLNFGQPKRGLRLQPGLVIAIEPMISLGSGEVVEHFDGSFVTREGCLSAHFEHTVAITENGPVVLTK